MKIEKRYDKYTIGRPSYWGCMFGMGILNQLPCMGTGEGELFFILIMVVAWLVVVATRCRDAGLNGWWCFAIFIPFAAFYFGFIRPDDHPKKLQALEKLRANKPNTLDVPPRSSGKHKLLDIPHRKGE